MIVAVISWKLEIIGAQSLKDKRSVVKSLKDRLHKQFNVSAAETGLQDVWQVCELSAGVLAGTKAHAEEVMQSADELVANEHRARIITTQRSFV